MADYIHADNSVVLATTEAPIYDSAASAYGLSGARWHEVSAQQVALGVERAVSLDRGSFAKQAAAVRTVADAYAPSVVARLASRRLSAIAESLGAGERSRADPPMMAAAQ
jgi:hypothetical protein